VAGGRDSVPPQRLQRAVGYNRFFRRDHSMFSTNRAQQARLVSAEYFSVDGALGADNGYEAAEFVEQSAP
jgi:hypothetical protein